MPPCCQLKLLWCSQAVPRTSLPTTLQLPHACVEPPETFLQVFVHSLLPRRSLMAWGEDTEELNQHPWWCLYQPGNSKATDNKEPVANLVFGRGLNCVYW